MLTPWFWLQVGILSVGASSLIVSLDKRVENGILPMVLVGVAILAVLGTLALITEVILRVFIFFS